MKKRPPQIDDPHRITINAYNSMDIGGWYMNFQRPKVLAEIDKDNNSVVGSANEKSIVKAVTQAINGGDKALELRLEFTQHAKKILL